MAAGIGHWNDPDMLLIGANVSGTSAPCVSTEEERTQMAIWSLTASPLIMGNDARSIKPSSREILLNKYANSTQASAALPRPLSSPSPLALPRYAISIDQDPLGKAGGILRGQSAETPSQVR